MGWPERMDSQLKCRVFHERSEVENNVDNEELGLCMRQRLLLRHLVY